MQTHHLEKGYNPRTKEAIFFKIPSLDMYYKQRNYHIHDIGELSTFLLTYSWLDLEKMASLGYSRRWRC